MHQLFRYKRKKKRQRREKKIDIKVNNNLQYYQTVWFIYNYYIIISLIITSLKVK